MNLGSQTPARVIAAIESQLSTLGTCPGSFYNETKARYLQTLVSVTPSQHDTGISL